MELGVFKDLPETPTNLLIFIYPPCPLGETRGIKDGVSGAVWWAIEDLNL
jgi:hypothetical protein